MRIFIALLLLIITGCSGGERIETKTYLLPSIEGSGQFGFYSIYVGMPDYLQGPGIVYQKSEYEISVANYNVWAENLDDMIRSSLGSTSTSDKNLALSFDKFNGSYKGYAELGGYWTVTDQNDDSYETSRKFNIYVPLDDDGYTALVKALGIGLGQLIQKIEQDM